MTRPVETRLDPFTWGETGIVSSYPVEITSRDDLFGEKVEGTSNGKIKGEIVDIFYWMYPTALYVATYEKPEPGAPSSVYYGFFAVLVSYLAKNYDKVNTLKIYSARAYTELKYSPKNSDFSFVDGVPIGREVSSSSVNMGRGKQCFASFKIPPNSKAYYPDLSNIDKKIRGRQYEQCLYGYPAPYSAKNPKLSEWGPWLRKKLDSIHGRHEQPEAHKIAVQYHIYIGWTYVGERRTFTPNKIAIQVIKNKKGIPLYQVIYPKTGDATMKKIGEMKIY